MKNRFILFLLLSLVILSCSKRQPSSGKMMLHTGWKFRQAGTSAWHPATVPGTVHTDLFNNKLIVDPCYRDHESKLQWIGMEDWEYMMVFSLEREMLDHDDITLVFEGIDTKADVFLNDSLIFRAGNMFRAWRTDCKEILKEGENKLRLVFHSTIISDSLAAASLPYKLPDTRGFTRKAPYQYGWDWGPRFVTCGLWKPVYLEYSDGFGIRDIHITTAEISDVKAALSAHITLYSAKKQKARVLIFDENKKISSALIRLEPGENEADIPFVVNNPELWWANGLGDPHLYNFRIRVQDGGSSDEKSIKYGIRSLKVVREADTTGSSFGFELNGRKVFMKGANYIPQDNFIPRVTAARYESLIKKTAEANMNMLRVWGGGIYENDIFYDLCDQYGILVWQDFMFACNMYPGDSIFLENVKQEATDNVVRLRNHACIALWCGNNEVNEGWHNWGWQKQLGYTPEDSAKVWNDYLAVFENILPSVVKEYDPERFYWPSSPQYGWGRKQSLTHGDCHYWGVWWGKEPFEVYEQKVGRFMSEYGFQGFPDMATIRDFTLPGDRTLASPVLRVHQKHPVGMETIDLYLKREYPPTDNFEEYNYLSQLCQAYGIKKAVEAHRRAMPYCMGTLYWQLNDCWPVISWSGLDYYYRPKALHYFMSRAYSDILLSFEHKNGQLKLYGISDRIETFKGSLELSLTDFDGNKTWNTKIEMTLKPNESAEIFAFIHGEIPGGLSVHNHLLSAVLRDEKGKQVTTAVHYFVNPSGMSLPESRVKREVSQSGKDIVIRLSTEKLAKNIYLWFEEAEGSFSDNYFDLLPGETREIVFTPTRSMKNPGQELKMMTMNDINKR